MMLTIAIIGLIGMIFSTIHFSSYHGKFDCNIFLTTITIIAWWNICLPLSIILMGFSLLIIIVNAGNNGKNKRKIKETNKRLLFD